MVGQLQELVMGLRSYSYKKIDVASGNFGDWDSSAGTNIDDSEWIVLEQNEWSYAWFPST